MQKSLFDFAASPVFPSSGEPECPPTRVDSMYTVPLSLLSPGDLAAVEKSLTLYPRSFDGNPSVFTVYQKQEEVIRVPRFYGLSRWGTATIDDTTLGEPMSPDARFVATLLDDPPQKEAHAAVMKQWKMTGGGVLVLPCGFGKTVISLSVIAALGRRTLVLVHKTPLLFQWMERLKQFMPDAKIGRLQQNTVEIEGSDVVVGMIHSVLSRDYGPLMNTFGCVVVDESHHIGAKTFSQVLCGLRARYRLGLTATPKRKDGLTRVLQWTLGDVAFSRERTYEKVCVDQIIYTRGNPKEILMRNGKANRGAMITRMTKDTCRTVLIGGHIVHSAKSDRKILVLSDRRQHLTDLMSIVVNHAGHLEDHCAYYVGGLSSTVLAENAKSQIIFATYSMAREGLDIPRLDTLILASPQGDIVQAVGRILRTHPDKRTPWIIEFVDPVSIFEYFARAHMTYYRKHKYSVRRYDDVCSGTLPQWCKLKKRKSDVFPFIVNDNPTKIKRVDLCSIQRP